MPSYDYQCKKCEHVFEKVSRIADRHNPAAEPCPDCLAENTVGMVIGMPLYVDNHKLMGRDRKLDMGFKEVMSKVHESTPGSNLNDMVGYKL
jgi:putative FmdB family regulatory protein